MDCRRPPSYARTLRRLLLTLLVLALVLPGSAAAAPRLYLGFLDDLSFRWQPDRTAAFDQARQADASVIRTVVRWYDVAPVRPANGSDSWDGAYDFRDVDEFVRNAQQ